METKNILRIVVASPSDVQDERRMLDGIIDELNLGIAATMNLRLELSRWEDVSFPGFHPEGPQGLIDPILNIEDCEVFLGIFWRRFGTPAKGAGSGTEHEFQTAYQSWKTRGRPQIMFYFRNYGQPPQNDEEKKQREQLDHFKKNFPKEGFSWNYKNKKDFERLVRNNLTQYIKEKWQPIAETSNHIDEYLASLTGKEDGKTVHGFDVHCLPITIKPGNIKFVGHVTLDDIRDRCIVIHGPPACGKTTLVKRIITTTTPESRYIPIEIPPSDHVDILVIRAIVGRLLKLKNESAFEKLENTGRLIFIFDGLNEIKPIRNTSRSLLSLAEQLESSRFLVTCRSHELKAEANLYGFKEFEIQALSREDQIAFIKTKIADEQMRDSLQKTFEERDDLRSMCSNQFLFLMTVRLMGENRLFPEKISDFYSEFLSGFLIEWEKAKGVKRMRQVLEDIAYAMVQSSSSKTYLEETMIDELWNGERQVCTESEFTSLLKSGFVEKRGSAYRLFQETFQEYLLASWLVHHGIFPVHLKEVATGKWSYKDEFELSELVQRFYLELSGIRDFIARSLNSHTEYS
jgi:GTPase SAR1 family protein